jgi:hypothetical protein
MSLPEARRIIRRYKSFLCLTVAALIGPATIYYGHGSVESKPAVIVDGKDKHKKKKEGNHESAPALVSGKIFQGGAFEASDVISVPGADGALFVDDNRPDEVFWMRLDQDGRGNRWTKERVTSLRNYHQIACYSSEQRECEGWMTPTIKFQTEAPVNCRFCDEADF